MIKGIGLDIVEIDRIRKLHEKSPTFANRILSNNEKLLMENYSFSRQVEFLAGRFAAKEAFSKAAGTGIGITYSFKDIEILKEDSGKPYLLIKGSKINAFVSITHSMQFAAAQVIVTE